jgi:hypothetical protein
METSFCWFIDWFYSHHNNGRFYFSQDEITYVIWSWCILFGPSVSWDGNAIPQEIFVIIFSQSFFCNQWP